jgi:hypothetical protein
MIYSACFTKLGRLFSEWDENCFSGSAVTELLFLRTEVQSGFTLLMHFSIPGTAFTAFCDECLSGTKMIPMHVRSHLDASGNPCFRKGKQVGAVTGPSGLSSQMANSDCGCSPSPVITAVSPAGCSSLSETNTVRRKKSRFLSFKGDRKTCLDLPIESPGDLLPGDLIMDQGGGL